LGHDVDEPSPVDIPWPTGISSISVGYSTVLALDTDGNAYGWGEGDEGQLGLDNVDAVLSPRLLPLPDSGPASALTAGYDISLVLVDGRLYGAGTDEEGQLGQGRLGQSAVPVLIDGLPEAALPD